MSFQSRCNAKLKVRIRLSVFIAVCISICPYAYAQCDQGVSVYFGNGFNDVNNGALNDAAALYDRLARRIQETSKSTTLPCSVQLAHDTNSDLLRKVLQAAVQKLTTEDEVWNILNGLEAAPPWMLDVIKQNISVFDPLRSTTAADLSAQVAAYRADLLSGKQVVLVAHSQGNLFANEAYAQLQSDSGVAGTLANFHILAVATPASKAADGYWMTSFGDFIWNIPTALTWTTLDNSLCLPFVGIRCHLFESYLAGNITGASISDFVLNFLAPISFGDVGVQATLDGAPWPSQGAGVVSYVVQAHTPGPTVAIFGSSVPSLTSDTQAGGYSIGQVSGGPQSSHLVGVSPSADQSLLGGQTVFFTLNFASNKPPTARLVASSGTESATDGQTLSLFVPTNGNLLVDFDASASSDPNGGGVSGWNWVLDGLSFNTSKFAWPLNAGTHTISLTVKDDLGLMSTAAQGTIEIRTIPTYSFSPAGPVVTHRDLPTATLLSDGRVLVAGGNDGQNALASAEIFDPITNKFIASKQSMSTPRFLHTATLLGDGKVLIEGGYDHIPLGSDPALASAEIYDPSIDTFSLPIQMQTRHSSNEGYGILLPTSDVLLAGGENGYTGFGCSSVLSSAQLFHATGPSGPSFTFTTGSLTGPLQGSQEVVLPNMNVVLVGGFANCAVLAGAQLYEPTTQSFTNSAAQMSVPREAHTATLTNDGKVLVTGGYLHGGVFKSAELYSPLTDSFTLLQSSMLSARFHHTATLLDNGLVLLAAGFSDGSQIALGSTELYNPSTLSFITGPTLNQVLGRNRAVKLIDGRVLIIGEAGAEIFGEVSP